VGGTVEPLIEAARDTPEVLVDLGIVRRNIERPAAIARACCCVSSTPSRLFSGAYRDRTGDLRLAKPTLSQLS
jgi:hypothetical protein